MKICKFVHFRYINVCIIVGESVLFHLSWDMSVRITIFLILNKTFSFNSSTLLWWCYTTFQSSTYKKIFSWLDGVNSVKKLVGEFAIHPSLLKDLRLKTANINILSIFSFFKDKFNKNSYLKVLYVCVFWKGGWGRWGSIRENLILQV